MSKFGILTFHRGANYGGFLQAWHLRQAIRNLGHSATVINYQSPQHKYIDSIRFEGWSPNRLRAVLYRYFKAKPFKDPVNSLSDHALTTDVSDINWAELDGVVVGSDVVWDYENKTFGNNPAFFGMGPAQKDTKFFSYAPSCGETKAGSVIPKFASEGLKRFDHIYVRDENTAAFAESVLGKKPEIVVDPTWLQDDPEVSCSKIPDKKYILVYGPGLTAKRSKDLKQWCESQDLLLITASSPCADADHRFNGMDPFEWVDFFRRAEGVVTSTFHGLLYAIKYQKPLIFMERKASQVKARIAIERCQLEHRVVTKTDELTPEKLNCLLPGEQSIGIPADWLAASQQGLAQMLGNNTSSTSSD